MSKRAQIRKDIALKLSDLLKDTDVFVDQKEIDVSDFPCVFVSTPNENLSLKAQPDLILRELEVHIQGLVAGENINTKADKMADEIENALKRFTPVLRLTRINFEVDALGEHAMGAFLMIYETEYEEKLWN